MGTDQAAYQSGKHYSENIIFLKCVFVFLLIAHWMPWALVTEDKLTWEWLSHQSLSLHAIHLRLWASRPKFCPQNEMKKKKNLALALTSYFAFSNCLPTWVFSVCLEELGPLNTNGYHNLHLWDVLTQVAKDQDCIFFFFFATKAYCMKVLSLNVMLERCAHAVLWSSVRSCTRGGLFLRWIVL